MNALCQKLNNFRSSDICRKALNFTYELNFILISFYLFYFNFFLFIYFNFFFYQFIALRSCAVDGNQMYSGGSVFGRRPSFINSSRDLALDVP